MGNSSSSSCGGLAHSNVGDMLAYGLAKSFVELPDEKQYSVPREERNETARRAMELDLEPSEAWTIQQYDVRPNNSPTAPASPPISPRNRGSFFRRSRSESTSPEEENDEVNNHSDSEIREKRHGQTQSISSTAYISTVKKNETERRERAKSLRSTSNSNPTNGPGGRRGSRIKRNSISLSGENDPSFMEPEYVKDKNADSYDLESDASTHSRIRLGVTPDARALWYQNRSRKESVGGVEMQTMGNAKNREHLGSIVSDEQDHSFDFYGQLKCYSPRLFQRIRGLEGVDEAHYRESLSAKEPYQSLKTNSRSGELFFLTADRKYIIKTISEGECRLLKQHVLAYYLHLHCYPYSLLNRVMGMYKLTLHPHATSSGSCGSGCSHHDYRILVLSVVYPPGAPISLQFDLKGSLHQRQASSSERNKNLPCYKDLDFIRWTHRTPEEDEAISWLNVNGNGAMASSSNGTPPRLISSEQTPVITSSPASPGNNANVQAIPPQRSNLIKSASMSLNPGSPYGNMSGRHSVSNMLINETGNRDKDMGAATFFPDGSMDGEPEVGEWNPTSKQEEAYLATPSRNAQQFGGRPDSRRGSMSRTNDGSVMVEIVPDTTSNPGHARHPHHPHRAHLPIPRGEKKVSDDDSMKIFLGRAKTILIRRQLERDVNFFNHIGSMDYSLLVCMRPVNRRRPGLGNPTSSLAVTHIPTDGHAVDSKQGTQKITNESVLDTSAYPRTPVAENHGLAPKLPQATNATRESNGKIDQTVRFYEPTDVNSRPKRSCIIRDRDEWRNRKRPKAARSPQNFVTPGSPQNAVSPQPPTSFPIRFSNQVRVFEYSRNSERYDRKKGMKRKSIVLSTLVNHEDKEPVHDEDSMSKEIATAPAVADSESSDSDVDWEDMPSHSEAEDDDPELEDRIQALIHITTLNKTSAYLTDYLPKALLDRAFLVPYAANEFPILATFETQIDTISHEQQTTKKLVQSSTSSIPNNDSTSSNGQKDKKTLRRGSHIAIRRKPTGEIANVVTLEADKSFDASSTSQPLSNTPSTSHQIADDDDGRDDGEIADNESQSDNTSPRKPPVLHDEEDNDEDRQSTSTSANNNIFSARVNESMQLRMTLDESSEDEDDASTMETGSLDVGRRRRHKRTSSSSLLAHLSGSSSPLGTPSNRLRSTSDTGFSRVTPSNIDGTQRKRSGFSPNIKSPTPASPSIHNDDGSDSDAKNNQPSVRTFNVFLADDENNSDDDENSDPNNPNNPKSAPGVPLTSSGIKISLDEKGNTSATPITAKNDAELKVLLSPRRGKERRGTGFIHALPDGVPTIRFDEEEDEDEEITSKEQQEQKQREEREMEEKSAIQATPMSPANKKERRGTGFIHATPVGLPTINLDESDDEDTLKKNILNSAQPEMKATTPIVTKLTSSPMLTKAIDSESEPDDIIAGHAPNLALHLAESEADSSAVSTPVSAAPVSSQPMSSVARSTSVVDGHSSHVTRKSFVDESTSRAREQRLTIFDADGGILSEDGNFVYYIGIIDFLSEYSAAKKFGRAFHVAVCCANPQETSPLPPDQYAKRFLKFMDSAFA